MLIKSRSPACRDDGVLFVERTNELAVYGVRLRELHPKPERKRVLIARLVVCTRPETWRASHGQVEASVKRGGGPNQLVCKTIG